VIGAVVLGCVAVALVVALSGHSSTARPAADGATSAGVSTTPVSSAAASAPASTSAGVGACAKPVAALTVPTYPGTPPMPPRPKVLTNQSDDASLQALGLFGAVNVGPVSAALFRHYLDATGTPYAVSVADLLAAQPAIRTSLDQLLRAKTDAALVRLRAVPACGQLPINSGWVTYTDNSGDDWQYALHSFQYQLIGLAWIGSADATGSRPIQVQFQAVIADTYNFNANDASFARFEQLAKDGWAADFSVTGQTTVQTVAGESTTFTTTGLALGS
jgi:hypothetical protein